MMVNLEEKKEKEVYINKSEYLAIFEDIAKQKNEHDNKIMFVLKAVLTVVIIIFICVLFLVKNIMK